jgi:hypothetical protein
MTQDVIRCCRKYHPKRARILLTFSYPISFFSGASSAGSLFWTGSGAGSRDAAATGSGAFVDDGADTGAAVVSSTADSLLEHDPMATL